MSGKAITNYEHHSPNQKDYDLLETEKASTKRVTMFVRTNCKRKGQQ